MEDKDKDKQNIEDCDLVITDKETAEIMKVTKNCDYNFDVSFVFFIKSNNH